MYFLASASILAIDLVRHPNGAAVADVTDRVLALSPSDLEALGRPAPAEVRQRVLDVCAQTPRRSTLMDGVVATLAEGLPSSHTGRTVVEALSETLLGGLVDLLDLLRCEQPLSDAPPEAVQVALDAVTAAWAGREAVLDDLVALRAPWVSGLGPVPPSLPETSYSEVLREMLDQIARRGPEQWQRVALAHRRGRRWSLGMHTACQAGYDAGRLTDVARAQLAAARALRLSGASAGRHAHSIAMAVTAAVQAVCTADLIDAAALRGAWDAGS